jgi:hypothetical protein
MPVHNELFVAIGATVWVKSQSTEGKPRSYNGYPVLHLAEDIPEKQKAAIQLAVLMNQNPPKELTR